jgi:hypothetical protein
MVAPAPLGLSYDTLVTLKPCSDRRVAVANLLGGAEKWHGNLVTARQAKNAGVTFHDMMWAASAVARTTPDVERRLRLWMADCAAHVLHIFERERPSDMRVRECIIAARRFARGEIDAALAAACAAAREAASEAAWAAAWDAASDAAWAAAWAARDAAREAEESWQFEALVARLSDPEPDDLVLPAPIQFNQ